MPEDKNTVDIDTSGPGAEVQVPEDKTFENEVEVVNENTENNTESNDTSEKSDEQLDVRDSSNNQEQETKKKHYRKRDSYKGNTAF